MSESHADSRKHPSTRANRRDESTFTADLGDHALDEVRAQGLLIVPVEAFLH
jgi:hypothetical protein